MAFDATERIVGAAASASVMYFRNTTKERVEEDGLKFTANAIHEKE